MDKVIKIIIQILAALLLFIIGWFGGSFFTRRKAKEECNAAIKDLQKEHKEALKANKQKGEEMQEKKDEIIERLKGIIERLLSLLSSDDGTGRQIAESASGKRLQRTLLLQAGNLRNL